MHDWNEIRTVAIVARLGSVSAAARELGVHRATVIRHIALMESQLERKLFVRHAQGYTPTELGLELQRIGDATQAELDRFKTFAKVGSDQLGGELIVTSFDAMAPLLMPAFNALNRIHPAVRIKYIGTTDPLSIAAGEAHVAIRAGGEPHEPDCHTERLFDLTLGLYASAEYVARWGKPDDLEDLSAHRFVGPDVDGPMIPLHVWLRENVPDESISFVSSSIIVREAAVRGGHAIGILPSFRALSDSNLMRILPNTEWTVPHWFIAHKDVFETEKVQALAESLRAHFASTVPVPEWG